MSLRTSLARVWASSPIAAKTAILDAKYDLGWVAEIPTFQNLNWLHNKLDNNQLSLAERGVFEWGSDVVYKKGALVWRETDGFIYVSLVEATTEVPSATATTWKRSACQLSRVEYDTLVASWLAHVNNTSNPHNTTAAQVGAYDKQQIDTKVATLQTNLDAHANDPNNPHQTTALQVGAVPSTGGTYTGEVTFPAIKIGVDGRVDADATKLEFNFKTSAIGVDAVGRPFSRRAGVTTPLLLETDYLAQRYIQEPNFGVPLPSFALSMQAHLYPSDASAAVEVEFLRPVPLNYTDKFGVAQVAPANKPAFSQRGLVTGTQDVMWISNMLFPSNNMFTASMRTYTDNPTASAASTWLFGVEGIWSVSYAGTDVVFKIGANTRTYPRSAKQDSILTFLAVGTIVNAFQDGVFLGSMPIPAGLVVTGLFGFPATGATIRNSLKMWHIALTAFQVSTL